MNKDKYLLYAKYYCDTHDKSYTNIVNNSKIKEYAKLFLNQEITKINNKLKKEKIPLIKHNLTRIRQGLTEDLDELKKDGDFNV